MAFKNGFSYETSQFICRCWLKTRYRCNELWSTESGNCTRKKLYFNPPSNLIIYLPNIASSIGHFRLLQFGKLFLGISQALFLQNLSWSNWVRGCKILHKLGYSRSKGFRFGPLHFSRRFLAKIQNSSR